MKTMFYSVKIISNFLVIISSSVFLASCHNSSVHTTTGLSSLLNDLPSNQNTTTPDNEQIVVAANSSATTTTTLATTTIQHLSALRGRSIISNILLRAANLNTLNDHHYENFHQKHHNNQHYATTEQQQQQQQLRQQQLNFYNEEDEDSDSLSSIHNERLPSSQISVPTDSGEDPLESTTIMSMTTAATSTTDDNINNQQIISQQQAPIIEASDSSELAVDSNNVTTIIDHFSASNQLSSSPVVLVPAATEIVVKNTTMTTTMATTNKQIMSCEQAYTQCALRKACEPALRAYNDHCHELVSNQTNECSQQCLNAMIALRSSEEGADLASCDCQSDDYCLASKQRSLLCKAQVDQAVDPKTIVSCSTASWICMSDQSCAPALGFYYRYCRSLLTQRHCSARCNNSLIILHSQPKAMKLISCQCDGSEEFPCLRLKTYTEQLCLNKPHRAISSSSSSSFFNNNDDDDDNNSASDELTTEEESSNLTNNPENFVLGVPLEATAGGSKDEDDDGDHEDKNAAAAASSQDSSSYNGIQMLEDDWIPLISGRYFTNLHHQQQQQLHSQTVGAQQSKQRHKQKEPKQQQQPQQTRRAHRNMRQHRARSANATHHRHEGKEKSRFGRILIFAASTSSSANKVATIDHWLALTSFFFAVIFARCSGR